MNCKTDQQENWIGLFAKIDLSKFNNKVINALFFRKKETLWSFWTIWRLWKWRYGLFLNLVIYRCRKSPTATPINEDSPYLRIKVILFVLSPKAFIWVNNGGEYRKFQKKLPQSSKSFREGMLCCFWNFLVSRNIVHKGEYLDCCTNFWKNSCLTVLKNWGKGTFWCLQLLAMDYTFKLQIDMPGKKVEEKSKHFIAISKRFQESDYMSGLLL